MKILNLYCGIGGNRKLWEDVEVTAIELNPKIAAIYQDFFPDDTVIVADAHQYLLEHYNGGWDFIWSSPPCPTHSKIRLCSTYRGLAEPKYPDMKLYEEILFMKYHYKCSYVIENVIGYYEPLLPPVEINHHYLWANYHVSTKTFERATIHTTTTNSTNYGFDLSDYKIDSRKDQILRNCVNPELGKHIFDCAFKLKQEKLF